jgi:hypothetical protein
MVTETNRMKDRDGIREFKERYTSLSSLEGCCENFCMCVCVTGNWIQGLLTHAKQALYHGATSLALFILL